MGKGYLLLAIILLSSLVIAVNPQYTFKKANNDTLPIACVDINELPCSPQTLCLVTIDYPNGTNVVNNQSMTYDSNRFYFNLTDVSTTSVGGIYNNWVFCIGNNTNAFTSFYYEVNPTGIPSTEQRTSVTRLSIWFFIILGGLLILLSVLNIKSIWKYTLIILGFLSFLSSVNILAVVMTDEVVNPKLISLIDLTTAVSFYIYEFAITLLVIIWIFSLYLTFRDYISKKKFEKAGKFQ